jgi:hypothetical protein
MFASSTPVLRTSPYGRDEPMNRLTLRLTLLGLPFAVLFAIGYGLGKAAGWI